MKRRWKQPPTAIERAWNGDASAMPELRAIFDADPERWRRIGDLARQARASLLTHVFGEKNLAGQEAGGRQIQELRLALAGDKPTPLETALADRAAVALLDLDWHDTAAFQNRGRLTVLSDEALDRRRTRAMARALAACRTLAQVRRLLHGGPSVAVQVNVGTGRARTLP